MKAYKIISTVLNVILAVLYLLFIFTVSCMFEVFPWHDADGTYMLYMVLLWLPLCVVSLVRVAVSLVFKQFDKGLASLVCLNAIYIPLIFLLGFVNISFAALKVIGVISVITMILYIVLSVISARKSIQKSK